MQLTNSNTPDSSSGQDDFNLFDQLEPGVPSFQAHFSVPPATTKPNDNQRGKRKRLFFIFVFQSIDSARHHHLHFFHGLYNIHKRSFMQFLTIGEKIYE